MIQRLIPDDFDPEYFSIPGVMASGLPEGDYTISDVSHLMDAARHQGGRVTAHERWAAWVGISKPRASLRPA